MTRRALTTTTATFLVTIAAAIAAGCGSSAHPATSQVKVVNPAEAPGSMQLAAFDDGVGAVATALTAPVWHEPGGVAALDGSVIFSIRSDPGSAPRIVRLDPRTGGERAAWAVPPELTIAAVAPAGRWIALTDRRSGYGAQGRTTTTLAIFDTSTGTVSHLFDLRGDVQPEAFSTDGSLVFALHYFPGHYRVQTIEVDNGMVFDTIGRDKTPAEDMHGNPIHGVLSEDHTLLATLYRDPSDDDEPAFVHVLDLSHGYSFCVDLPAPFGTGAPGSDAIQLAANDVIEVGATQANRVAAVPIDAVHTFGAPVTVTYRDGTISPPPADLTALPGFEYVIGTISDQR